MDFVVVGEKPTKSYNLNWWETLQNLSFKRLNSLFDFFRSCKAGSTFRVKEL